MFTYKDFMIVGDNRVPSNFEMIIKQSPTMSFIDQKNLKEVFSRKDINYVNLDKKLLKISF